MSGTILQNLPALVRDPAEWQRRCTAARDGGARIALVPTMGFLHDGHLSLMREARRVADAGGRRGLSLATVFVNPSQFGPGEDLSRYPRDLAGDLAKCADAGVDWVLAPESPEAIYPPGFQTWVAVEGVSQGLCGDRRPGHFRGVATVVAKLFHLSRPHAALFGEKDWQQLQVIRAMVRDLDFGLEVVGMPTVREADGLALSSRNAYLSPEERRRAVEISRALFEAQARAGDGERDASALAAGVVERLERAGARVDYAQVVHPSTLRPVERAAPGSRLLAAVFLGRTRLIDNVALP
jgi:pantoate--beta-alanine ligase